MKTWMKYSALGLLCFVLGGVAVWVTASHLMTSYVRDSIGQTIFHDFQFSFERLASRDGALKSPAIMQENETGYLGLSTIILGQEFDQIADPQLRAEAVRIAKLIDADPRLQRPATKVMAQEATDARHCIIEKSSNPSAVVQCVRDSTRTAGALKSIARSD